MMENITHFAQKPLNYRYWKGDRKMAVGEEAEEFFRWARTRNIGCMFARVMFAMPEHYGIKTVELTSPSTADKLAVAVEEEIRKAIDDQTVEALVLVLPAALELQALIAIFKSLATRDGWIIREQEEQWHGNPYALIGLDVLVGDEHSSPVLSELVAFGPYAYLPTTRRNNSPVLTLRTKPELSGDPLPGRHERRANLASIPMDIPSKAFEGMWHKSQQLRAELDGADNPLARARISLAFPAEEWARV